MFYDRQRRLPRHRALRPAGGYLPAAARGQLPVRGLELAGGEFHHARETAGARSTSCATNCAPSSSITLRQAALERENATLRGLNAALPDVIEQRLVGEVISVEFSKLRQRLLVNRGGTHGVFKAQPVVTGDGVLGQVFRTGPFSSEIILITDAEHALPVQVVRSGVRTIALGTGHSTSLELPFVPQNYDVKVGDLLVTSGLGRVFPFGLPVARVTKVERDSHAAAGADPRRAARRHRKRS